MILEPTAKPVKFRIVCDGIEHSTIASLKKHFFITDIEERIKDGSLKGFFRQQGLDSFPIDAYQAADILFEAGGEIKDEESLLLWWRKHDKVLFDRHFKKYLPTTLDALGELASFHSKELKKYFGDEIYNKAIQNKVHPQYPKMLEQATKLGSTDAKKEFDQYKRQLNKKEREEERRLQQEREKPKKAISELTNIVASYQGISYPNLISKMRKSFDIYNNAEWNRLTGDTKLLLKILSYSIAIGSNEKSILKKVYHATTGLEYRYFSVHSFQDVMRREIEDIPEEDIPDIKLTRDFCKLISDARRYESPIVDIKQYLRYFINEYKDN